jgi:tRNA modification GTPase
LCDLAGLSEFPADELDALAQARARELVAEADLVLWIARADAPELARRPAGSLLVWSQIDRPQAQPAPSGAIAVSVPTGAGLAALRAAIAHEWQSQGGGLLGALRARHAAAWQRAAEHLERSWFLLQSAAALELCAEELRLAQTEVEKISGESGVEDVLDRIFARFCLGK